MSLLSSNRLHQLINQGVISGHHDFVNSASIDVRIGDKILLERKPVQGEKTLIDLVNKDYQNFEEFEIPPEGLVIEPNQFFLANTLEVFNLPNTISCEFKLRSSIARSGLQHMLAGWCDAGWHGSTLTMEFKNVNQFHRLLIKPGMRIGQMVFFEHEPVGDESYAVKGNYNNQKEVTRAFSGEGHK